MAYNARYPSTTGRPLFACIEPIKGTTGTHGQRFQLRVAPTADQSYTLQFQYHISPHYLTGSMPYAYGGPEHSETLLESCLAVAEKILDNKADLHATEFQRMLKVSQDLDRRKKPQTQGYNGDRSDDMSWQARTPWRREIVTVGGLSPS